MLLLHTGEIRGVYYRYFESGGRHTGRTVRESRDARYVLSSRTRASSLRRTVTASHTVNWVAIGFVYGTLSLISLFGFVIPHIALTGFRPYPPTYSLLSATKAHKKLVLAYFYLLIPCALFSAVMTLFSIAALGMDSTAYARTCQPPPMQYFPSCRQDLREFRLVPPIAFGVISLLQTCEFDAFLIGDRRVV
jgi:hypothetical protein